MRNSKTYNLLEQIPKGATVIYTNSDELAQTLKAHYPDIKVRVWKPTEFDFKNADIKKDGVNNVIFFHVDETEKK